jgi:hypothetical protein
MKRCNECFRELPLDKFRMDVPKGHRMAKCRECENARKRRKRRERPKCQECENARKRVKEKRGKAPAWSRGPVMALRLDEAHEAAVFATRCTECGASDGFMCRSQDESMVLPHSARIRDALKRRT